MSKKTISITNIDQFNKELSKAIGSVSIGARVVLTKVSMDTFRGLQNRTPRKTGRARAGWTNTIDTIPSEFVPPKGGSQSKKTFDGEDKIKFNSVINLTNNVEYIVPLDKGHSQQAKTGIVNYVLSRSAVVLKRLIAAESKRKIK